MTEENPARALPSRFGLIVTVGGVIGLGILRGPGEIAAVVTDPSLYLALWLLAGLFVLLSTAVSAELVGMTPRSGGFYSLIRRAFGPVCGEFQTLSHKFLQNPSLVMLVLIVTIVAQCVI